MNDFYVSVLNILSFALTIGSLAIMFAIYNNQQKTREESLKETKRYRRKMFLLDDERKNFEFKTTMNSIDLMEQKIRIIKRYLKEQPADSKESLFIGLKSFWESIIYIFDKRIMYFGITTINSLGFITFTKQAIIDMEYKMLLKEKFYSKTSIKEIKDDFNRQLETIESIFEEIKDKLYEVDKKREEIKLKNGYAKIKEEVFRKEVK